MRMTMGLRRALFGPFLLLLSLLTASCVIVRHGEEKAGVGEAAERADFDASGYVAQNWETRVLPDLGSHAVDLTTVLNALAADPEFARAKYGHRSEESAPYNFVVHGLAKIRSVDLESSAATAELSVPPPVEGGAVLLQICPVIRSSAIRDSLSFVKFGDFTNQVDFANLSRALNTQVKDHVVSALVREKLVGKTVEFTGAFTEDPAGRVLITPVVLEVKK